MISKRTADGHVSAPTHYHGIAHGGACSCTWLVHGRWGAANCRDILCSKFTKFFMSWRQPITSLALALPVPPVPEASFVFRFCRLHAFWSRFHHFAGPGAGRPAPGPRVLCVADFVLCACCTSIFVECVCSCRIRVNIVSSFVSCPDRVFDVFGHGYMRSIVPLLVCIFMNR